MGNDDLSGFVRGRLGLCMKVSDGFSHLGSTIIMAVGLVGSLVLLAMALKELPLGISYAIWTGLGIVGTSVFGVILFHEKLSVMQIVCMCLIAIGIIGLRVMEGNS